MIKSTPQIFYFFYQFLKTKNIELFDLNSNYNFGFFLKNQIKIFLKGIIRMILKAFKRRLIFKFFKFNKNWQKKFH